LRPRRFAAWLASDGEDGKSAAAFADLLWDACKLPRWPHEAVPGLQALDPVRAFQLVLAVGRARRRWRRHQVEELIRSLDGDKDPMGVGRVIALLGMGEVGG
jgi:hypothetical protein